MVTKNIGEWSCQLYPDGGRRDGFPPTLWLRRTGIVSDGGQTVPTASSTTLRVKQRGDQPLTKMLSCKTGLISRASARRPIVPFGSRCDHALHRVGNLLRVVWIDGEAGFGRIDDL